MLPKLDIGPDLALELLAPDHADALYRLTVANRDYLRAWLPWLDEIRGIEDTRFFIELARRQHADNNGFQTVIVHAGEPVGIVGHHGIDWPRRTTSLGYWLAESAQGRGLVTRACRAHLSHAFGALALDCVKIRCAVENRRSRAIPERLGFEVEATIRKAEWLYDHFVDHVVYAMRVAHWHDAPDDRG